MNNHATLPTIDFSSVIAEATAFVQENFVPYKTAVSEFLGDPTTVGLTSVLSTLEGTGLTPTRVGVVVVNPASHPAFLWQTNIDHIILPIHNCDGLQLNMYESTATADASGAYDASTCTLTESVDFSIPLLLSKGTIRGISEQIDGSISYFLRIILSGDNSRFFS